MRRLLLPIAMLAASALCGSAPTFAGNLGFKLSRPLNVSKRNFVSLPYLYFPNGDPSTPQSTLEVCRDIARGDCGPIGAGGVRAVTYVDKAESGAFKYVTQPCAAPFAVVPDIAAGTDGSGEGVYRPVFVSVARACTFDIVGSHDDRYSLGGASSVRLTDGNNPVSMPYHLTARDALELCRELNRRLGFPASSGPITSVGRFKRDGAGFETQGCGTPIAVFPLVAGDALFITVRFGSGPLDVEWNHY